MPTYLHVAKGSMNSTFGWSVSMHSLSSAAEAAAEASWHAAFKAFWNAAGVRALYAATNSWLSTVTYTLDGSGHVTTSTTTSETIAGTGTQSLPYECAILVTWRTAIKGKKGLGRWYLPPPATAALAVNGWTLLPANVTTFTTALAAMNTSWGGTLTPVIYHHATHTTDNILHADMPDGVYAQRRRGHKRIPARTTIF